MPRRLLIVRLSALGDTALTLPLACLLKRHHPDLELGWLVGERAAPLLVGSPCVDRLHILSSSARHPAGLWRLAGELRRYDYPLSIDPQGLTLSALPSWMAGIPRRVGFSPGPLESRELAPLLLNEFVRVPSNVTHVSERTLWLARALGFSGVAHPEAELPRNPVVERGLQDWWQRQGLGANTLIMGLGAGWPTKQWPPERAVELARAARGEGLRTVLLWGPRERSRIPAWSRLFTGLALAAPPTDVPGLLALLRLGRCYAGPDSAALHLAWLLGLPTFSWFGASDPARCAPTGRAHRHVAQGPHDWRRSAWRGNPLLRLETARVLPEFLRWLGSLPAYP